MRCLAAPLLVLLAVGSSASSLPAASSTLPAAFGQAPVPHRDDALHTPARDTSTHQPLAVQDARPARALADAAVIKLLIDAHDNDLQATTPFEAPGRWLEESGSGSGSGSDEGSGSGSGSSSEDLPSPPSPASPPPPPPTSPPPLVPPPSTPPPCTPPPSDPQEAGSEDAASGGDIGSGSGVAYFATPCTASTPALPPPASPPDAADYDSVVTFVLVFNGTLEEFDVEATKAALVVAFKQPSITAADITLRLTQGSIIVSGEVRTSDGDAARGAMATLVTMFSDPAATSDLFGMQLLSVQSMPTLSYASKPPASPPPLTPPPPPPSLPKATNGTSSSGDNVPVIIGATVGGICGLLALVLGVMAIARSKKQAIQPTDASSASTRPGPGPASFTSQRIWKMLSGLMRNRSRKVAPPPAVSPPPGAPLPPPPGVQNS